MTSPFTYEDEKRSDIEYTVLFVVTLYRDYGVLHLSNKKS